MNEPTEVLKVSDLYAASYVLCRCRLLGTEWKRAQPGARSYVRFKFANDGGRADEALLAYSNCESVNPRDFVTSLRSLRELVFQGRQDEEKGGGQ